MHVKVIFRWWWLRSRQEVDYHIWRCVHTPIPHNVLLPPFQFAWMHTLLPTFFFFFLPVERGIGRHDNNRLSKAPSTSHTSHYLTQTVQANACQGDFPMMVIKVKTRSGLPHMEMCSWLRSRQEVDYHIWRCVHTPIPP